jgi:hypothetical protein
MPIDIERFETEQGETLRATGPTNAETILGFLASHPEQAFTPREIYQETQLPRGSVGVVLSRLEDQHLVRHRGEYWAIGEDVDVDRTLTAMTPARAVTDRFGPEDPDEWGPGVEADTEDE